MKKIVRKVGIIFVVALGVVLCFKDNASAAEISAIKKEIIEVENLEDIQIENDISLDTPVKQEITYVDEDGESVTVGAEPVLDPLSRATYTATDGTWKIYWYTGVFNMWYNIKISNKNITSAYGEGYSLIASVSSDKLTKHSAKLVTYKISYKVGISNVAVSGAATLKAEISGSNLKTSFN